MHDRFLCGDDVAVDLLCDVGGPNEFNGTNSTEGPIIDLKGLCKDLLSELFSADGLVEFNGREAALLTLRAVIQFVWSIQGSELCARPLTSLVRGLEDLKDGRVVGLLRPTPGSIIERRIP
jgi:hypothetical protein